jgi:hypothetical protein
MGYLRQTDTNAVRVCHMSLYIGACAQTIIQFLLHFHVAYVWDVGLVSVMQKPRPQSNGKRTA